MQFLPTYLSRCLMSVAIVGLLIAWPGVHPAMAEEAEQPAAAPDAQEPQATEKEGGIEAEVSEEADQGVIEEIVIKGFRHSLEQSVDLKRAAVNVRETIVAEDIGKMPDLNLAEVDLSDSDQDGEYVGVCENFTEDGVYRLLIYAEDGEGNLSQPGVLEVRTRWPVYLPLVLR